MAVFTVSSGAVPPGTYTGTFAGVENVPANPEKGFGPGVRFKFTIVAGLFEGQTTCRVTGTSATQKNSCGRILSGLLGRALRDGELIEVDSFIGRKYMLVVAPGPGSGTRVDAIVPIPNL